MELKKTPIVKVTGLRKVYKGSDMPAVDSLNFTVNGGDIFGLLGPNGAGKSTTIMALCGLLRINAGIIEVCGLDMREKGNEIRKQIGVAPQEIALFPMLTMKENLEYFGRMYGLESGVINGRINDYAKAFGLSDKLSVRVGHFSGCITSGST